MFKNKQKHYHLIGIGGIGMSAIARLLIQLGHVVSGSDSVASKYIEELISLGANISIGHDESNFDHVDCIIHSTAIRSSNPEIQKAKKLNIEIVSRGHFIAKLVENFPVIAITGTHGKTTTSSMVVSLAKILGEEFLYAVGGIVKETHSNSGIVGSPKFCVIEADESDGTMNALNPDIAILTNIDNDHLSYYKTKENLNASLKMFLENIKPSGTVIVNGDDPLIQNIIEQFESTSHVITFGEGDNNEVIITKISATDTGSQFSLLRKGVEYSFTLPVYGKYNIYNACAAILSLSVYLDTSLDLFAPLLPLYKGVKRRQDRVWNQNGLIVVDDYAHHPTAIDAILSAINEIETKGKRIILFEPHRYTRTQDFWQEFVDVFSNYPFDLHILPIFPASEDPILGITSENLIQSIKSHKKNVYFQESVEIFFQEVLNDLSSPQFLLSLGAGPISAKVQSLLG